MEFNNLKKLVTNKNSKLIDVVFMSLNHVDMHNEKASIIGCFWVSDTIFLINTLIFSSFIDRLPNTINKNFRYHHFKSKKMSQNLKKMIPEQFHFDELPDQRNWIFRYSDNFYRKNFNIKNIQNTNENDDNKQKDILPNDVSVFEDENEFNFDELVNCQIDIDGQNVFDFISGSQTSFDLY